MTSTLHAGVSLVRSADALLDRSARSFTRAARAPEPGRDPGAAPPSEDPAAGVAGEDLVNAASDVVVADVLHRSGTLLIRMQREQDRALLDIMA